MSDNKKYYYLKLKDNFYDSEEMIMLQNMPNGYVYSDILIKLYLRSLKNDGKLMLNDSVSYTPKMLATIIRHKEKDVKNALKIFHELGLLEIMENGAIYMLELQNFIGESSTQADRKRAYRDKIITEKGTGNQISEDKKTKAGDKNVSKMSHKKVDKSEDICPQNVPQLSPKSEDKNPPEIELEIEKELEKELEIELHLERESERENVPCVGDTAGKKKKEVVESLPLKNNRLFPITEELKADLSKSYPGVDVSIELLKMKAWCQANPDKRKSEGKIMRFITGWLSRAAERTGLQDKKRIGKVKRGDYEEIYESLGDWPNEVV